ncbi:MAG: hypothetical protein ACR2N3_11790 [Pyrinomonadaceae bacterium]
MKKFLTLSILSLSIMAMPLFAEAKTAGVENQTTVTTTRVTRHRGRFNPRVRVVTRTRVIRSGSRTYRETIQTRHLPNGRTTTRVISRVRVR